MKSIFIIAAFIYSLSAQTKQEENYGFNNAKTHFFGAKLDVAGASLLLKAFGEHPDIQAAIEKLPQGPILNPDTEEKYQKELLKLYQLQNSLDGLLKPDDFILLPNIWQIKDLSRHKPLNELKEVIKSCEQQILSLQAQKDKALIALQEYVKKLQTSQKLQSEYSKELLEVIPSSIDRLNYFIKEINRCVAAREHLHKTTQIIEHEISFLDQGVWTRTSCFDCKYSDNDNEIIKFEIYPDGDKAFGKLIIQNV